MLEPVNVWRMLAEEGVSTDDIEIARTWSYTFHVRKAQQWRKGRVLLLGDAAHVMPPFAGQGISGAFRDAANVVWKVHAAVTGHAGDELLDTYQSEREPHHDAMTNRAILFGRLVMPPNRTVARIRDFVLRALWRTPGLAALITRKIVEPTPLGPGCLTSVPRKRFPVGYLLAPARVAIAHAQQIEVDQSLGLGWSVLGLDVDPLDDMLPQHRLAWQQLGARFLTIRPGTSVVHDGELGDPTGQLWDAFTVTGARYLVVRPDRYVYHATDDATSLAPPKFYFPSTSHRAKEHAAT